MFLLTIITVVLAVESVQCLPLEDPLMNNYEALQEKFASLEILFQKVHNLKEICNKPDDAIKAWCMLKQSLLRGKLQRTKRSLCSWPGFPRCQSLFAAKESFALSFKDLPKPVANLPQQVTQERKPVTGKEKPVENQLEDEPVDQASKPVKQVQVAMNKREQRVKTDGKDGNGCIPGLAHCKKGKRGFEMKQKAKVHCPPGWVWCQ